MNTNQPKRGRGQPRKEPTTVITFRVPAKWAEEIKSTVKQIINNFKQQSK